MRGLTIAALTGLSSIASSQLIDLDYVESLPDPTYTIIPDERAQTVPYNQATAIASVVAVAMQTPVPDPNENALQARHLEIQKRHQPCESLNNNANTYEAVLDPAESFLSDENLANQALNARTPDGYTRVYQNLKASAQANGYMGYSIMSGYNVQECADKCSRALGCQGFNTYFERSPSKVPGPNCPNPGGAANPFCVLWGGPVTPENARNEGQWREQYHVVIAASNGYVLTTSLDPLSSKAINAPLDCNTDDSYMGMRLLNDNAPFDPQRCAAICEATSQYNIEHPGDDASRPPRLCKFYNTYILNKNYGSQGQICAMYTQSWDPSVYATNDGQWRGNDHYTISSSVFFHNATDVTTPVCPADITRLQSDADAGAFCTSFNSYVAPATSTVTSYTGTTTVEACGAPTARAKRDETSGAVVEAVVAVYPSKVEDGTITGTAPALATIPAAQLGESNAYASATSAAIAELRGSDSESSVPAVTSAPSATPTPSGASSSAAAETTPETTSTAGPAKRAVATPQFFAGRDSRQIASACSQIISTGTPTVTVQAQATETTYNNCAQYPTTCQNGSPAQLIDGSFSTASYSVDDTYYTVNLPFPICIYDTCSTTVNPSSNGLITLGTYKTPIYSNTDIRSNVFGNEAVLMAFWDDLYIYQGQQHYLDYSLCGDEGRRTVTFDWRMGRFNAPSDGPLYSFSATFYEDQPSRVQLKYFGTTDQGNSASIGMQGTTNGQRKFHLYLLLRSTG